MLLYVPETSSVICSVTVLAALSPYCTVMAPTAAGSMVTSPLMLLVLPVAVRLAPVIVTAPLMPLPFAP